LRAASLVTVVMALAFSAPLRAAPNDSASDAFSKFMAERGLDGKQAGQMVDQVRTRASDMVLSAMNFLGVPYRFGGDSEEEGFDCSGFTRHVFEQGLGLLLPRRAEEQARAPGLERVKRDELQPGDLVFFRTLRRTFSHVGVYIGEGKFIHSPHTGASVRVDNMDSDGYWSKRFTGARRAEDAAAASSVETAEPATPTGQRVRSTLAPQP